ncbi:MAG: hypothetical protein KGJ02_07010 [Verrucomicrobiota bacterium]|nr:hypothetical protein [Verrucomicrobiota bacterium]
MTQSVSSPFESFKQDWITPPEQLERLGVSPIQAETSRVFIPEISHLVDQYLLDPQLINWHTALKRLDYLPPRIPPLPNDIHDTLDSRCRGSKRKCDGTRDQITDTHVLYLKPPGTLNEFVARVKAYGEQAINKQGKKLYPFGIRGSCKTPPSSGL